MPSYVISGASRGIGFAIASVLSADKNNTVVGLVRKVEVAKAKFEKTFPDRKNIHILYGDQDDRTSLEAAAKATAEITGGAVDVLIVNAGIGEINVTPVSVQVRNDPDQFEDEMKRTLRTNVYGVIYALTYFAPLVEKSKLKKAVVISSAMGDIDLVNKVGVVSQVPYAISKAAVNMAVAKFNVEYRDRGVLFFAISPGMVASDFGLQEGQTRSEAEQKQFEAAFEWFGKAFKEYQPSWRGTPLSTIESATLVTDVISKATIKDAGGAMISHNGNTTEWL